MDLESQDGVLEQAASRTATLRISKSQVLPDARQYRMSPQTKTYNVRIEYRVRTTKFTFTKANCWALDACALEMVKSRVCKSYWGYY